MEDSSTFKKAKIESNEKIELSVFMIESESAMKQEDAPADIHEHNKPASRRDCIITSLTGLQLKVNLLEISASGTGLFLK